MAPHQQAVCAAVVAATLEQHEAAEVDSLEVACVAAEVSLAVAECAAAEAESLEEVQDAGKV